MTSTFYVFILPRTHISKILILWVKFRLTGIIAPHLEKLRQDIMLEIKKTITETVNETVREAFEENIKRCSPKSK